MSHATPTCMCVCIAQPQMNKGMHESCHTHMYVCVQRAATYALGQVAERVVPEDMVWSYNNVTAQPATKSTWLNVRWNVLRQAFVPNNARYYMICVS